jgi:hypothetical protein
LQRKPRLKYGGHSVIMLSYGKANHIIYIYIYIYHCSDPEIIFVVCVKCSSCSHMIKTGAVDIVIYTYVSYQNFVTKNVWTFVSTSCKIWVRLGKCELGLNLSNPSIPTIVEICSEVWKKKRSKNWQILPPRFEFNLFTLYIEYVTIWL